MKLNTSNPWWSRLLAGTAVLVVAGLVVAAQLDILPPPLFGREEAALHRAVFWGCLLLGALLIAAASGLVALRAVDLLRTGRRLDEARLRIGRLERQADPEALRRAREILSQGPQGKDSNGAV